MKAEADQQLVTLSQAGDRDAFAQIVSRYQTLVCSVAYGATGRLTTSEDLAQEAFVAAWRSIHELREPNRLRAWLCGIVRNLANSSVRREQRDALRKAATIESSDVADTANPGPAEASIAKEEVELLDRSLTRLPSTYREPLVLYYREEQSVAKVAELLDLSSDAVKQRLARGRQMLRSEVAALVERGLAASAPGRAFTAGVLASLPVLSSSAKAATLTVTTAKGTSAMNAAGISGLAGMILGPLVGLLGGWFGYSMSLKSAQSDRERSFIKRIALWAGILCLVMLVGFTTLTVFGRDLAAINPYFLAGGIIAMSLLYVVALVALIIITNLGIARIRREDGTMNATPEEVAARLPKSLRRFQSPIVYESKARLLGIPLLSVRFNGAMDEPLNQPWRRPAAVGWIAIGDKAIGILFASGSVAVGGIAAGAFGIGIVSIGGFAAGVLALGGGAVGWWANGGLAIGYMAVGGVALAYSAAMGGMAVAWHAATGGMAIAREFAVGGLAFAEQANTELAKAHFETIDFFRWSTRMMSPWFWSVLVVVILAPLLLAVRFARRENEDAEPE